MKPIDGDVTCLVQLVHGILVGCLGSLFVVCIDPWPSIVEVGWEDGLRTIDHEERRVASGPTGDRPQALDHRGNLSDPSCAKLVQPIEDPRLEAL